MRRASLGMWMLMIAVCACATGAWAANDVRISQVYGGGGSSFQAATYNRDYIELFNAGSAPVDISGWAVEYTSITGNWGSVPFNIFSFPSGTIMPPCTYLLIACPSTNNLGVSFTGANLPVTPDFDGVAFPAASGPQLTLGATSGKVALFSQPNVATPCGSEVGLIDKVAYGTSGCPEGTAAGALSITSGAVRKNGGATDTDNNAADFDVVSPPVPRNSSSLSSCTLPPPTSVVATGQCNAVSVDWSDVAGAIGYRIRRDGVVVSGVDPIVPSAFVDASPAPGVHCYDVCTVSGSGNGAYSSPTSCAAPILSPTVKTGSKNASVPEGSSAGFSVFAEGNPLTFTWRKDGIPIPGAPNARTIQLNNVLPGDAGGYDCEVCNPCGCVTSAVMTLTVCPAPVATMTNLIVCLAGSPSVSIPAIVTGASFVQWYGNGKYLMEGSHITGVNTATLSIASPTAADNGPYQFQMLGVCGQKVMSNACYLAVVTSLDDVTIVQHPLNQTVAAGLPASFSVLVAGGGTPTYQWQRYAAGQKIWVSVAGAIASTHAIGSVTPADYGDYRCVITATNGSSVISKPASLNQILPTITSVGYKPFSCTSAGLSWNSNVPMTFVVKYGADCKSLTNTTATFPLGINGSTTLSLPGSSYVAYQVIGTTPDNVTAMSVCGIAYYSTDMGNLSAQVFGVSFYGDLYGTEDGIPVRIRLTNTGCTPILGPFTLASMDLNGLPPRRSDGSIDLPRDLLVPGLAAGETREVDGMMFSRSEVGLPSLSTGLVSGVIKYGSKQQVNVSAKVVLP